MDKKLKAVKEAKKDELSYTLESGDGLRSETFNFRYSPEFALSLAIKAKADPRFGNAVTRSLGVAYAFYDELNFTQREKAIAAAFFDLGTTVDQVLLLWPTETKFTDNLTKGRKSGTEAREKQAKDKHELIRTAIDDLYRNGIGWKMTYPEISKHLIDKRISRYTPKQTAKLVKKFGPAIKKKYK